MINLKEPFKLALQSLLGSKLRTLLTTLGVVIGIAAVITLVSMGEGAKTYVLDQVRGWGMGANALEIHPGKAEMSMPELTLTYADTVAMKEHIPEIVYLVPEIIGKGRIKFGPTEYTPSFTIAVSADYPNAVSQKVTEGRFYSKAEEAGRKHVVVLGKTVANKLFGNSSAIGERIKINNIGFVVIGLLEEKGSMLTYDMDDMALIPTTVAENVLGKTKIIEIFLTIENEQLVPQAIKEITNLLVKRHKKEDFHIHTQQGMIDIINNILNALTGIVSAIAAISLLVGGIGIMNIMLVAVSERTREIGIRKAIGAKQRDIFMQFILEAVLITVVGAIIGIFIGTLAAWGIMAALKMKAVIAWQAAAIACFGALLVGTFFGVYPAMRAAALNPIDALRSDV
ncbi:MAG: ABC transporter permease [Candidatus Margulisiibacteriota bacterium]